MRLGFTKVGDLLYPTDENGVLVEDVQKCTVTSSVLIDTSDTAGQKSETETVMTLTVKVVTTPKEPAPTAWVCTECDTHKEGNCRHEGSKPRMCRWQTNPIHPPVWREADAT